MAPLFERSQPRVRFHIDASTSDGVAGWAFSADGLKEIRLLSGDRVVARAAPSHDREDVRAAHPHEEQSLRSGFAIPLGGARLDSPRCTLDVEFVLSDGRTERGDRIELYVPGERVFTDVPLAVERAPFPPPVLRVLADLGAASAVADAWTDERIADAIDALSFAVLRGPKRVPGLYAYLGWLRAIWERFAFNERQFPRFNAQRDGGDKDFCSVASSALELFGIAHHLYVLRSRGLGGHLLEFGCFKGFSTSCLSHACAQLGIEMHVFDSFAGLPASDSTYHGAGDFAGSLDEVQRNVREFGAPDAVRFHPGFFADSLRGRTLEPLCIWMDVDLESSSRDVMSIVDQLPVESCVFSHECWPGHFPGGVPTCPPGPDAVLPPIVDAFARIGRRAAGRFVGGHTGAIWDATRGIPALPADAAVRLKDLA